METLPQHDEKDTAETAVALARWGLPVFPLRPGTKEPATPHGFKDASRDPKIIREWWRSNPRYGLAVATGRGLVVLDVDTIEGHGKDGPVTLAELERQHGDLPQTVESITPSGGRHVWFLAPRIGTRPGLALGLDLKAEGGYVVVPPTALNGGRYSWDLGAHPTETPLAPAPDWLLAMGGDLRGNGDRPAPRAEPIGEAYRRVTDALRARGADRRGDLWTCPAHHDPNPSLSVHEAADQKVLLKCFAGCTAREIMSALQRPMAELFPRTQPTRIREAAPPPQVRDLTEVRRVFTDHFYMPDADVVDVTLATVVAHRLPGDPLWVMLIGPPGGGKTEVIQSLTDLPEVHALSSLTAQTFASGLRNNARASLLRRLEQDGKSFLTLKDFTSVLTLHRESRAEVLSQLRELFDGQYRKEFGSGFAVEWSGRLGLLAGVTPIIDAHHSVTAVLGERFVYYRLPQVSRQALTRQALAERASKAEVRRELRRVVRGFLENLDPPAMVLDPETTDWLVAVADFTAWARSGVLRDGYDRSVVALPEAEIPTRVAQQLAALYSALRVLGNEDADAARIVAKVGDDSIPRIRLELIRLLAGTEDPQPTDRLAETVGLPTDTTKERLEDLLALRLVDRTGKQGTAHTWSLTEDGRRAWDGSRWS